MLKIAIGTRSKWDKVKKYYPDYKFYHEQGKFPRVADKILLITSADIKIPKLECENVEYIPEREFEKESPMSMKIDASKPRLTKLEFHVANHCNLNCNSCNHYCNLDTAPSFPDIETVKKDLLRIKELFWGIGTLYLVGGEPLLNKELHVYCDICRELFPDSEITVITNGILLPKLDYPLLFDSLKKNDVNLLISRYPVTDRMMKSIEESLKGKHIRVSYTPIIQTFTKKLTEHPTNNKKKAYKRCHEKECHYLENGKIYGCTLFGRIKMLNEKFGLSYPDVGLDIYKYDDGWVLQEKLENLYPYCSYCASNYESIKWGHGNEAKLDFWIVNNPDKYTIKTRIIKCKEKIGRKLQ